MAAGIGSSCHKRATRAVNRWPHASDPEARCFGRKPDLVHAVDVENSKDPESTASRKRGRDASTVGINFFGAHYKPASEKKTKSDKKDTPDTIEELEERLG